MARFFTRGGRHAGNRVFVPKRDADKLARDGWASMPDMVEVPANKAVYEIERGKTMQVRLIGLARNQELVQRVARYRNSRDWAFRPSDLVTLRDIARKTKRSSSTIVDRWMVKPDWPAEVMRAGKARLFHWPEVVDWMQRNGRKVRRG